MSKVSRYVLAALAVVALVVMGIGGGWLGLRATRHFRESAVVDQLRRHDPDLRCDWWWSGPACLQSSLGDLSWLRNANAIAVRGDRISAADLARMRELGGLEFLSISSGEIGESELQQIGQLSSLRHLDFEECTITETGLSCLSGLTSLERLKFWWVQMSGNALRYLPRLPSLYGIALSSPSIGDEAIPIISQWKYLDELELRSSGISDEGYEQLCKELPNTTILYNRM